MRAVVYNPYWQSMGGGERYSATVIKFLLDLGWQVEVDSQENISQAIWQRFNLDVSEANFKRKPSILGADLLWWVSDGSLPTSLAHKTLVHMQVPFTQVGGRKLSNKIKSNFYTFVANSQFTKRFVDEEFGVNCQVLYPPVDTDGFKPEIKTRTIVYVSRFSNLTQAKNHLLLLECFKSVAKKIPGWKLILAGGVGVGTDQTYLEKINDESLGFDVEIVTNPKIEELRRVYGQASIFCSPSGFGFDETKNPDKVEHFGISVVEAMASGAVPLVTNLGGHKEIVTNEVDGFLWSTETELKDLLLQLCANESLRLKLSQSALKKSKIFSTERFNSEFSKLL